MKIWLLIFTLGVLRATAPAALIADRPTPPTAAAETRGAVEPEALDREIARVLQQREYAWRQPALPVAEDQQKGWFMSWTEKVVQIPEKIWEVLTKAWIAFTDWLKYREHPPTPAERNWHLPSARESMTALLGLAAVGLLWAALRWRRKPRRVTAAVPAATPMPDLHAEETSADQLPEERWLQLAGELLGQGELRLALRASYLGALAHLGRRELLAIARHKSNLDYRRELARRAAARRPLVGAFELNVTAFERAWYGSAPVTTETLEDFHRNLDLIRAS